MTANEDYLRPDTLIQLHGLELRARLIVEGIRSGTHQSPYHGFNVEFAEHRQYAQGDDLRYLDWKVYGRSDKLYLKQYEQETNQDVVLLVDVSGSMNYGTLHKREKNKTLTWTKFDHAAAIASALSYLVLKQQDRVGLAFICDRMSDMIPLRSNPGHWRQIVSALSAVTIREQPTNLLRAVNEVTTEINRRALFVLISDLHDEVPNLRSALARLQHRGHDVILFHVFDRQELEFQFRDTSKFIGLENEPQVSLDPKAIRSAYLDVVNQHCKQVRESAMNFGYDYQRLNTHESLGPALRSFLTRRNARSTRRWGMT